MKLSIILNNEEEKQLESSLYEKTEGKYDVALAKQAYDEYFVNV